MVFLLIRRIKVMFLLIWDAEIHGFLVIRKPESHDFW